MKIEKMYNHYKFYNGDNCWCFSQLQFDCDIGRVTFCDLNGRVAGYTQDEDSYIFLSGAWNGKKDTFKSDYNPGYIFRGYL